MDISGALKGRRYTMKRLLLLIIAVCIAYVGYGEEDSNLAKVYCKDRFVRFRNESYPREIANGEFADIPDRYVSWKFSYPKSYPAIKDRGLKFEVKEAGLVHVITTEHGSKHLISDGWEIVGRFCVVLNGKKWPDVILAKHHEEGEYEIGKGIDDPLGFRLLKK